MAATMSKIEISYLLLLKVIEAQPSLHGLDVSKTSEEWPAITGATISARAISERLRDISKDAVAKGFVKKNFSVPRSNHGAAKGKGVGRQQRGAPHSKKRIRESEDEDDVIEMTAEGSSKIKKIKTEATSNPNQEYLSPPSSSRVKSRSMLIDSAAPGRPHATKRTTCETEVDGHEAESDSDLDSLAGLEETPTKAPVKKKRTLPARSSRAVRTYYADDDVVDAGGLEESDDEFDPFKIREEEQKRDARRQRGRHFADGYESDE